jgi:transcriptional regulator with XRE-family HTH domain
MAKILSTLLPVEVGLELAARLRTRRLERGWPRAELAERSGVSEATIKLFENGGQITLSRLLLLARALGALADFDALFLPRPAKTLAEIETREHRRQRGRRRP